jgi:hypothetical protein
MPLTTSMTRIICAQRAVHAHARQQYTRCTSHTTHHVDDLRAADDGADESCVAGAVHEREVHALEAALCTHTAPPYHAWYHMLAVLTAATPAAARTSNVGRRGHEEAREAEVERDAALLRLRVLVQRRRRQLGAQRTHEGRLARVHVAQHADIDVQGRHPPLKLFPRPHGGEVRCVRGAGRPERLHCSSAVVREPPVC